MTRTRIPGISGKGFKWRMDTFYKNLLEYPRYFYNSEQIPCIRTKKESDGKEITENRKGIILC
jgi:hypothetical protein